MRTSACADENQKNPHSEMIKKGNFKKIERCMSAPIADKNKPALKAKMPWARQGVNRKFEVRLIEYLGHEGIRLHRNRAPVGVLAHELIQKIADP